MTRWLVTGVTGLLGANAAVRLAQDAEVVGVARRLPSSAPVPTLAVDLTNAHERADLVARAGADVVLHTAALASLEACETDPDLARVLNAEAAADLAAQAARAGIPFVHISTDAVFDGSRGGYSEEDVPAPLSVYGRTKLLGESQVLEANPAALVARVNFYGWSPSGRRSLAEFFYHRLRRGEVTAGFSDVYVSTLHVGLLVEALLALVDERASGVLHVASREGTSKYDFGRALAREFGFDEGLVQEAKAVDVLRTPRGSHLDLLTDRAASLLGAPLPDQATGLTRLRAEHEAGLPSILSSLAPTEGA